MAKAKVIDPCRLKGRYLGSRGSGRSYLNSATGFKVTPSSCECQEAFRCFASGLEFLAPQTPVALDLKSESRDTDFKAAPSGLTDASRELLVVPCRKSFLKPDSTGTKAYQDLKANQREKSAFFGCEDVDRYLIEEGSLNYDIREGTGTQSDVQNALDILDYDDEIRDQNYEVLFTKFSDRSDSKTISDDELRSMNKRLESARISGLHLGHVESLEILVGEEKSGDEDAREKRIARVLRLLTLPQRKAVRLVYLENGEGKTQGAIAEELGITLPSLRDRLNGAFGKIAREFQDLFPEFKQKEKKKRWTPKRRPKVAAPIRITSHGVTRVFTPTERNPRPLGALRPRRMIDQDKIKRKLWADRRYAGLHNP